jgi:hypothetical protein
MICTAKWTITMDNEIHVLIIVRSFTIIFGDYYYYYYYYNELALLTFRETLIITPFAAFWPRAINKSASQLSHFALKI